MKSKPINTQYFSPDYFTARRRFRQAVQEAGGQLTALQPDVTGPGGESLTIDIAWLGNYKPVLRQNSVRTEVIGFRVGSIAISCGMIEPL